MHWWDGDDNFAGRPQAVYAVAPHPPIDILDGQEVCPTAAGLDVAVRLLRAIREQHPAASRERLARELLTDGKPGQLDLAATTLGRAEDMAVVLGPVIIFLEGAREAAVEAEQQDRA